MAFRWSLTVNTSAGIRRVASAPRDANGDSGTPYFEGGITEEFFAFCAIEFLAKESSPEVPLELAMLHQLMDMRPGAATYWMTAAMLVISGQSTPDAAYAGWLSGVEALA